MNKKGMIITICAIILALVVAAVLFFVSHALVDGALVKKDVRSFSWRSDSLKQPEDLKALKNLETLDMRSAEMTLAEYESLAAMLPGVEIQWLVPVQNAFYPEDTQTLQVTALTLEDIAALKYLPRLTAIDATGCADYDTLLALQASRPDLTVHYTLSLGGESLPESATSVSLVSPTTAELAQALQVLPKLEQVSITGCQDPLGVAALAKQYPNCHFSYDIPLAGQVLACDTPSLTVGAESYEELEALLPCFTALTDVTVTGNTDALNLHALADAYPDIRFHYSFSLLGKTVHTDDALVVLDNIPMTDTQALEAALPYFHGLKQVDMVDCGIANEEMAALNSRHPDTLFVWTVMVGPKAIRTDTVALCPLSYWYRMDDDTSQNIKYLTELRCLDIGHCFATDFSFLYSLTKLEYLIVADTELSDISFCENMPNLMYLEIFKTRVRDISPLANCPNMEYINCSYIYPKDVSALCGLKKMKVLWMRGYEFEEQQKQIQEALPECWINFSHGYICENGWRKTEGYYAMRDLLGMPYMDQDRP